MFKVQWFPSYNQNYKCWLKKFKFTFSPVGKISKKFVKLKFIHLESVLSEKNYKGILPNNIFL